ncbi:MAG: mechanosensitive ion channel [Lysobacterales bacterium]|jgi:small-conductance mechanosensitive channel
MMQEVSGKPADSAVIPPSQGGELPFGLDVNVGRYLPDWLQPGWAFLEQHPLLLVAILFLVGYVVGKVLQWLLESGFNRVTRRTRTDLDDRMIHLLTAPVVQTTVILSLIIATKSFGLAEGLDRLLVRLLVTMLLLLWGRAWFGATTLALNFLAREPKRFPIFQARTRPLFEMGIKLVLVGLFIWLFMLVWKIDGTAWLASAGVIGIAVGFAARDTLANLISGVSIIADAPYKIGDFIVLDTGERGVVTELGMRSTRLLTRDDVEISIPNAVMGNAKIINESGGPGLEHRIRIPVGVAYGTEPKKVVELLERIGNDNGMTVKEPAPRARMRAFGASSLDFELLAWIHRPEQRGLAKHEMLMEIDRVFREENIQIPFPQRDLHIRSGQVSPAGTSAETG